MQRTIVAVGILALTTIAVAANGLAGYEGGPPLWNLAAMAAQGGVRTWQGRVTASSGFSDGTHTAVFLPNGGIVSTGPD